MKTAEIPPEAARTTLTGAVLSAGVVVVARMVLTVPTSVCVIGVLLVAAVTAGAAVAFAAGFRAGEASSDDE